MYKCLVLDHDDTVVDSSASIHYPSFIQYLEIYRPHLVKNYDLPTYFRKNFHPGILELFTEEIGLNAEELAEEEAYWSDYVKTHSPRAYDGILEVMREFRRRGGLVVIDSHSFEENIRRDLADNALPTPDYIYGWDLPKDKRKPSPFTLYDLMERFSLSPSDIIVVDDLKPGYDMARAAGVTFAAAGWAYDVPEIESFMRKNCDYYLKTPHDLRRLVFGDEE